jgi:hypothetical protein
MFRGCRIEFQLGAQQFDRRVTVGRILTQAPDFNQARKAATISRFCSPHTRAKAKMVLG